MLLGTLSFYLHYFIIMRWSWKSCCHYFISCHDTETRHYIFFIVSLGSANDKVG